MASDLGTNQATALASNLGSSTSLRKSLVKFGSYTGVNLADTTTYYIGEDHDYGLFAVSGGSSFYRVYFPFACHITQCRIVAINVGGLGTSEAATASIRVNNTTDTQVTNALTFDVEHSTVINSSLNIAIAANDYAELKLAVPSMATNPSGVYFTIIMTIEAD
jgi:hypothetical protein